MQCPGLNGVWRACPPSIPGLTAVERDVFGALGGPLMLIVVLSAVAILTILAGSLTDGLGIGSSLRPRRGARTRRIDAARRHAGRAAHLRLVARAAERRGVPLRILAPEVARSPRPSAVPARAPVPSILLAARVYGRRYLRLGIRRLRPAVAQVADMVGTSAEAVVSSAGALASSAEAVAASAEAAAVSARDSIAAIAPAGLLAPRTEAAAKTVVGAPPIAQPPVVGRRGLSEAPIRGRVRARTTRRGSRSAAARGRSPGSRVGA